MEGQSDWHPRLSRPNLPVLAHLHEKTMPPRRHPKSHTPPWSHSQRANPGFSTQRPSHELIITPRTDITAQRPPDRTKSDHRPDNHGEIADRQVQNFDPHSREVPSLNPFDPQRRTDHLALLTKNTLSHRSSQALETASEAAICLCQNPLV